MWLRRDLSVYFWVERSLQGSPPARRKHQLSFFFQALPAQLLVLLLSSLLAETRFNRSLTLTNCPAPAASALSPTLPRCARPARSKHPRTPPSLPPPSPPASQLHCFHVADTPYSQTHIHTHTMSILSDPNAPLFSTELISPQVAAALPDGYTVRPVQRSDYQRGFLDVLRVLTTVGDVDEAHWDQRYDWISRRNDEYFLICVLDGQGKIVGTGALIVERKL